MKIAVPVSTVGYHWEELVAAYLKFKEHQIDIDLFTPGGKPAVPDPTTVKTGPLSMLGLGTPSSIAPGTEAGRAINEKLAKVQSIESMNTKAYWAIYIPGGHGCLKDINRDQILHTKIEEFYKDGKVLGGVCHATSTFTFVKVNGRPITMGRKLTGFPDFLDENLIRFGLVPTRFLPLPLSNDKLLERSGANIGGLEKFLAVVLPTYFRVDAPFVTGMGPKAAKHVAAEMAKLLKA